MLLLTILHDLKIACRGLAKQPMFSLMSVGILAIGIADCTSISLHAAVSQTGCCKREGLDPKVEAIIDEFRASVPEIMDKGDVPGAAIALVDEQGILWTEGFGHTGGKPKRTARPTKGRFSRTANEPWDTFPAVQ
jgi:CubicO group peptidase (beta-lactamase class C family)